MKKAFFKFPIFFLFKQGDKEKCLIQKLSFIENLGGKEKPEELSSGSSRRYT
jgi:hypothetical protein